MTVRAFRPRFTGAVALMLALTAAVYSSSFRNRLLNWDDAINVSQNLPIRDWSASNIRVWFTEPLLGMYSPLVYASYAADYAIGGLEPAAYHATNLALHLLCVVLVCAIVLRLTGHRTAALIVAALFAVHPVNVAAVTPVSVRSSLLYAIFYLAAYLAYLAPRSGPPGATRLAISLFFLICAALSKSAAAIFPVLLLLTDWYRGRRLDRSAILEKTPFFAVAIAAGVTTLMWRTDVASGDPLQTSAIERAALAAYQLGFYAVHALVPVGLSPFYPYPERAGSSLPLTVLIAPVLVVAAVMAVYRAGSVRRPLAFGLLFFVLHLALVLKIVPLGEEFTADRYLYLPMVGLCIAAAELAGRAPIAWRKRIAVAAVVVIAVWGAASYARNADWRNDLAFNNRILERYPRTATALANRAAARLQIGEVREAWQDSTDAIRLDPANARAYFNRATAGMLLGRPAEAMSDVTNAIALDPALPASYELRAQARLNAGDFKGARDDANRAIELAPSGEEVFKSYVTRGLARAMLNDGSGALADLDRAIALNPSEPALLLNRGQVRINLGDTEGGCADLREALARGREDARPMLASRCGDPEPTVPGS